MQKQVKISQTVTYLEDKLEKIEVRLNCLLKGEHYQDFQGSPFDVSPWQCETCKVDPELHRKNNGKWICICPRCSKEAIGKDRWESILRWNRENCSLRTLEDIPFQALHKDCPGQVENIIIYLCDYYYLKKKQVGLSRQIAQMRGVRPPGKKYQKRLTAFYHWALLAKDLQKNKENDGSYKKEKESYRTT